MKVFATIKIFRQNKLEFNLVWRKRKVKNLTEPRILKDLSTDFYRFVQMHVTQMSHVSHDKCVHFIYHTNCLANLSTVPGMEISLNAYIANIKYHNLCTDPLSEHVPTAVTKVMLRRVISHNSSQMDSPEIKSASQTAS